MIKTVKLGAKGKPYAECPSCKRIHQIYRRGTYRTKPNTRFHCKNSECKTIWYTTPEEQEIIVGYYGDRAGGGDEPKNRQRGENGQFKSPIKPPAAKKPDDTPPAGNKDIKQKERTSDPWNRVLGRR